MLLTTNLTNLTNLKQPCVIFVFLDLSFHDILDCGSCVFIDKLARENQQAKVIFLRILE